MKYGKSIGVDFFFYFQTMGITTPWLEIRYTYVHLQPNEKTIYFM